MKSGREEHGKDSAAVYTTEGKETKIASDIFTKLIS
jgi:hypothetical protein